MWSLILGAPCLCKTACGSAGALLAYLGMLQWFDLLQRGKFSFYTALYRETRVWDDCEERALPADLLREVLCGVLLGPFWGIDMALPHVPFVAVTDASSDFGIGGCTASLPPDAISELARVAERDGEYVVLNSVVDKPRGKTLGTPHSLSVGFDRFTTMFSVACVDGEHINLREARALLFICAGF